MYVKSCLCVFCWRSFTYGFFVTHCELGEKQYTQLGFWKSDTCATIVVWFDDVKMEPVCDVVLTLDRNHSKQMTSLPPCRNVRHAVLLNDPFGSISLNMARIAKEW